MELMVHDATPRVNVMHRPKPTTASGTNPLLCGSTQRRRWTRTQQRTWQITGNEGGVEDCGALGAHGAVAPAHGIGLDAAAKRLERWELGPARVAALAALATGGGGEWESSASGGATALLGC